MLPRRYFLGVTNISINRLRKSRSASITLKENTPMGKVLSTQGAESGRAPLPSGGGRGQSGEHPLLPSCPEAGSPLPGGLETLLAVRVGMSWTVTQANSSGLTECRHGRLGTLLRSMRQPCSELRGADGPDRQGLFPWILHSRRGDRWWISKQWTHKISSDNDRGCEGIFNFQTTYRLGAKDTEHPPIRLSWTSMSFLTVQKWDWLPLWPRSSLTTVAAFLLTLASNIKPGT